MEEHVRYWLLSLPKSIKRVIVLLVDSIMLSFSVMASYYLRLEYVVPFWGEGEFLQPIYVSLIGIAISTPLFLFFGLYRGIFRHSDFPALLITVKTIMLYGLIFSVIISMIGISGVPRSIGIIQPMIFLIIVILSRWVASSCFGLLYKKEVNKNSKIKVVIYGAGATGRELCSALRENSRFKILCFVDDNISLHGRRIMGYPILGLADIQKINEKEEISYVILTIPILSPERKASVLKYLKQHGIPLKQIPSLSELAEGKVLPSSIFEPSIEEILGRTPMEPNPELMKKDIQGLSVLVTGAGGTIGGEICRQVLKNSPTKLIMLENNEYSLYVLAAEMRKIIKSAGLDTELDFQLGSVTNKDKIDIILRSCQPDTIYHAAAYKHVSIVEENPFEGLKNNFLGTMVLAKAAINFGVRKFVFISTDKAVRPSSVMGASKRLAEMGLQALAVDNTETKFAMVRFGNVLNSSGSVVPLFKSQILDGGPITITHPDVSRYFMTISEATQLVIQAGAIADELPANSIGAPLYLLDMGKPVKIADLAVNMARLYGKSIFDPQTGKGDIELLNIGLAPGEKLHEELLIDGTAVKTFHQKISVTNETFFPLKDFEDQIKNLESIMKKADRQALFKFLSNSVNGYQINQN